MDHLMVDPLNYRQQVQAIFHQHGWDYALTDEYARKTGALLRNLWENRDRSGKEG